MSSTPAAAPSVGNKKPGRGNFIVALAMMGAVAVVCRFLGTNSGLTLAMFFVAHLLLKIHDQISAFHKAWIEIMRTIYNK